MFIAPLFCLFLAFLLIRHRLRSSSHLHPPPPPPPSPLTPERKPLPPPPHVSFVPEIPSSPPTSPSLPTPAQPRWPFQKRRPSQFHTTQRSVDQFSRLPSPVSFDVPSFPKPPRRLSLSLPGRRRSSSTSYTSTLVQIDQAHTHTHAPSFTTSSSQPTSPLHRTKFVNPFSKHSRSRTLSPPSSKSPDPLSSYPSGMTSPLTPSAGRRTLVNKFKSIFKSIPSEPSSNVKPIFKSINSKFRKKSVSRTQPYGPPWNAPMPLPDLSPSPRPSQKFALEMPPLRRYGKRRLSLLSVKTPTSPNQSSSPQPSPRTFINELDERLILLQHQQIQDLVPLVPHEQGPTTLQRKLQLS